MRILKKIDNSLKAYLSTTAHTRIKFNELAQNKKFVNERVDGYVDLHNNKQIVIDELKKQICNIIRNYSKDGNNILDFGCGTGRYLKELENDSRYNLFGLDIAYQVIEKYTRKNVKNAEIFSTDILTDEVFVNRYNNFFDIIYSVTTLEYISPFNLNKLFMRFGTLLVKNGTLILQFPVPKNILECFVPGYFRHQPISIEKKLKKNRFIILESNGMGTNIRVKKFNKNNSKIREFGYLIIAKNS